MNKVKVIKNCTISVPGIPKKTFHTNDLVGPGSRYYYPILWTGNGIDSGIPSVVPGQELYPIPVVMKHTSPQIPDGSGLRYFSDDKVFRPVAGDAPGMIFGNGSPASSAGATGFWYFDYAAGTFYEKTSDTVWTSRYSIPSSGGGGDPHLHGYFFPETYGAVGDGVTDDTAAVQAAIDAAFAAGGGTVILSGRYAWKGDIIHKGAVTVRGVSLMKVLLDDDFMDRGLIALDGTARYCYGQWTGDSTYDNPGGLYDLMIHGADVAGTTQGMVIAQCVDGLIQNCRFVHSGGNGFVWDGAQNSTMIQCLVGNCSNGEAMRFARTAGGQGSGNIKVHDTYFATSKMLLRMTTDPANFPCHDIYFTECLFENYMAGDIAQIDAGSMVFDHCVFTNSNSSAIPTNNCLVKISNQLQPVFGTIVIFETCWFNGGGSGAQPDYCVLIDSTGVGNIVYFNGHSYPNFTSAMIGVTGATTASRISVDGTVYRGSKKGGGVIDIYSTAGGGSLYGVYREAYSPTRYQMPDDSSGSLHVPLMFKRLSDSNDRGWLDRDFTMYWLDGSVLTTRGSIKYDSTNQQMSLGGGPWFVNNAWGLRQIPFFVTTIGQAVALSGANTASPAYGVVFQANSASANITISGGAAGSQIQILLNALSTTGNTVSWPSNIHFDGPAPQPQDNKMVVVDLVAGSSTDWYEVSRSARQPKIQSGSSSDSIFTVARTATITGYTPTVGDILALKMVNGALANSPTLSINGGTAVPIYIAGSPAPAEECAAGANAIWMLYYEGTKWVFLGASMSWTTATTSEMQTGTGTTQRWLTPALVKAAVNNWPINTQTGTTYTLALTDAGKRVEGNNASAITFTIPPNSSVAFPIGTWLEIEQYGAGQITVAAGSGVTIRSRGGLLHTNGQYSVIKAYKRATDEWVLSGDLA